LTLRRLFTMVESRIRHDWIHTAHVLAALTGRKVRECMPAGMAAETKPKPQKLTSEHREMLAKLFPKRT